MGHMGRRDDLDRAVALMRDIHALGGDERRLAELVVERLRVRRRNDDRDWRQEATDGMIDSLLTELASDE